MAGWGQASLTASCRSQVCGQVADTLPTRSLPFSHTQASRCGQLRTPLTWLPSSPLYLLPEAEGMGAGALS